MYKNENMYIVQMEKMTLEDIMQNFYKGADIVFVTEGKKFRGGVTKGDMQRYSRLNGEDVECTGLINMQMRYITFISEEQAFADAQKIFDKNWRISNIPVVDETGKLLFQIDHLWKKGDIENIAEAVRNGSLDLFLKSDDIEKIMITGSDSDSLQKVQKILDKHCKSIDLGKNISIEIVDNIQECCYVDKRVKVISLSDGGALYINQNTEYETDVVSAKELSSFIDFSKMKKVDLEIVETWKNLFGYEKIAFCSPNKYIADLVQMIKNCGLQVCNIKSVLNSNIGVNFLNSLDVLLFSKEGFYYEKLQITELVNVLEWIYYYKQITESNLTIENYLEAGIKCLNGLKEEGYEGVLFETNSLWTEKLKNKIKEECEVEVIDAGKPELSPEKRYVVDFACLQKANERSYVITIRDHFLRYSCEYEVYKRISKLCRNVYIYPAQLQIFDEFKTYPERNRYNYIHHKTEFPDNFVRELCDDEKYPLDEVILDMQDCQPVKINDGYIKFLSNYHSKYFNTDTYGSRIVADVPLKYSKTIWLVGACNFVGYAVEDKHTTASCLQKKINELGYPYRVVDLSCDAATSFTLYNKILDRHIGADDIIIILEHALIMKEKEVDVDYRKINKILGSKIWYWDGVGHPGHKGYEIIAEKILHTIQPVLDLDIGRKFYLEKTLELKVLNYISELKRTLNVDVNYQTIIDDAVYRKYKTGAIVMNCNPFTYGHQYLIETASRLVDLLYVFVVEENKSVFSFENRFCMVKEGAEQYKNVVVVPSGEFMISAITFPGYFLKDSPTKECYDTFLDLKIFAHYIAPALGISMRMVGEEPSDKVTAQYNHDMKMILGDVGINVIEIPRKKNGREVISASKVRELLREKDYTAIEKYVPKSTMKYLM